MNAPLRNLHPFGDVKQSKKVIASRRVHVDSYAGRLQVEWNPHATVTPVGQLPFFIEFLKTARLFDDLVNSFPYSFTSNNASKVRDILGSMMLSFLSGQTRYSHITALRGESVNTELLGMKKLVS